MGAKQLEFHDGQFLSLMGQSFTIRISDGGGPASKAKAKDGFVDVTLAGRLNWRQKKKHVRQLSIRAISRCLQGPILSHVSDLNARHFGFELGRVRLKDQSGRWGSYSKRTNSIYLNFRLLFAPQEILDYVIIHELAHIRELNHSRDFWKLVATAVPDYKERRKWLRKNCNRSWASETMQVVAPVANKIPQPFGQQLLELISSKRGPA